MEPIERVRHAMAILEIVYIEMPKSEYRRMVGVAHDQLVQAYNDLDGTTAGTPDPQTSASAAPVAGDETRD